MRRKISQIDCGWTKSVRTILKPWLKPLLVGIHRGNRIISGFLRWCEMDFVHPQYVSAEFKRNDTGNLFSTVSTAQSVRSLQERNGWNRRTNPISSARLRDSIGEMLLRGTKGNRFGLRWMPEMLQVGNEGNPIPRSSSGDVIIRVPLFSVVYFSRGTLPQERVKGHYWRTWIHSNAFAWFTCNIFRASTGYNVRRRVTGY